MNLVKLLHLPVSLILASQSPRRISLLRQIGLDFEVIPSGIDEEERAGSRQAEEYVEHLAEHKAREVAGRSANDCVVIGADTIVILDSIILNKPVDEEDAVRMLTMLSGRTHTVLTGVALVRGERVLVRHAQTQVTFRTLDDEEIRAYVAGGSPMDKAGAYGIQDDYGAVFVRRIEGCYYNIVGLPLELLYSMLKEFGDEQTSA